MTKPPGQPRLPKKRSTADQKPRETHEALARIKALRRAVRLLNQETALLAEALQLIDRYHFHADELTEAGVTYELVRALETHHPMVMGQD